MSQVFAGTPVEPHAQFLLSSDNAKAIVLDFVQAFVPGRQFIGLVGRHGAMNPAGKER